MTGLTRSLRLLVAIRLIVLATVVLSCVLIEAAAGIVLPLRSIYLVAGLGLVLTVAAVSGGRSFSPETQAYLQLTADAILVTALVYVSGGPDSVFTFLYLILIGGAAFLLLLRGAMYVASISSLFYGLLIEFVSYGLLPPAPLSLRPEWSHPNPILPMVVNIGGFYASAFLTARIAENLQSARREAEARRTELERIRALHTDVIDSMSSGLATSGRDGRLTFVNPAGRAILRGGADLIGRPIDRIGLFSPDEWSQLRLRLGDESSPRGEIEIGAERRPIGFSIHTLRGSEGFLVLFQDLTELKRLEREARSREKLAAVGQLAAGIAHEIRNPLASISGSAQLLGTEMKVGSSERRLVEIMISESKRLSKTLEDFLRYARPRERKVLVFDIAASLSEAMELFGNSDEVSDRHELTLDVEPKHSSLAGDPDQVRQIFWNVARNAVSAMPDGGRLAVSGREEDGWYTIVFRDSGKGMTAEEKDKLFHPFATAFDGGTGLGMAIVRRLVDDHLGTIDVDTHPGSGTTIQVRLPRGAVAREEISAA